MTERTDIKSLNEQELTEHIKELGIPAFRAKQIWRQLFLNLKTDFEDMSDIPKSLLPKLNEHFEIRTPKVLEKLVSKLDGTEKYLFTLYDGSVIESVLMRYEHGNSVCVSTQVGCRQGCAFCASTKNGFVRSLTAGEILGQIEAITREHSGEEFRVDNIVLMGIGEPLDNFDNVVKFLRLVNDKNGLNIGYRHISLSTCGLVPEIKRLAEENLPITLSISLHAPNDEIRDKIMPVNRRYPMNELLKACRDYQKVTGRRISFEYALIDGVNDSVEHAKELAGRLRGIMCHVNLIPVNPIKEKNFKKTTKNNLILFTNELNNSKINATVRRRLGADIDAACGQLRNKRMQSSAEEK
jgi:23S rRNA (adenine2503-C2)-methyltransferase